MISCRDAYLRLSVPDGKPVLLDTHCEDANMRLYKKYNY